MKRIALLTLADPRFTPDDPLYTPNLMTYRTLIEQVTRVPMDRQSGASIDEMRRSIRVLDALEACHGEVLTLEDADWEHLRNKVERMPWATIDRRILRFIDDVVNASELVPQNGLLVKEQVPL
jgi:hypothetical protein